MNDCGTFREKWNSICDSDKSLDWLLYDDDISVNFLNLNITFKLFSDK